MQPLLSVIAISKNEIGFIDDWFGDINSQTIRNQIEVIVCDGGSTDGTVGVIERRVDERPDDSCAVFSQPSPAYQLNNALAKARGEVCVRIDVDVRCPTRTTLEEVLDYYGKTKVDFAFLAAENLVDRNGNPQGCYKNGLLLYLQRGWAVGYGAFMSGKTDAIKSIGGFDENLPFGEDSWLFSKALILGVFLHGYKVGTLPVQAIHLREMNDWLGNALAQPFINLAKQVGLA